MKRIKGLPKTKAVESFSVGVLLAVVGGYLDIYSYLARGKVFANTQTGNLVLLGYSIANGNGEKILYYLFAILAFMSGVSIAKIVEYKFVSRVRLQWIHVVVLFEIGVLLIVGFIPEGDWNVIANMLVSLVCGLQVQGFRKVCGKSYSTIMFTGNLRNLGDAFVHYILTKEQEALGQAIIYFGITIMFIIGGWLGALTTQIYHIRAVGLAAILLGVIFIIIYREEEQTNYS